MPLPSSRAVPSGPLPAEDVSPHWQTALQRAVRHAGELIDRLQLPAELREAARRAAQAFPLLVPESYLNRMEPGNPHDPLLRQVLPLRAELDDVPGFSGDALNEAEFRTAPGLLQKYAGRALLMTTGTCAVHCRYCFRRQYPYGEEPRRWDDWQAALQAIRQDTSLREIILSGGDPLMLSDRRLSDLCRALDEIPHLQRLRIHSRLPVVLPQRLTPSLLRLFQSLRQRVVLVIHANHPREIAGDCAAALEEWSAAGLMLLNQAVLLRGINDSVETLAELSERLIAVGVLPYYLHQLDRVKGTAHFEVPASRGRKLIAELRKRLPGYAVPQYVREVPGAPHKIPL